MSTSVSTREVQPQHRAEGQELGPRPPIRWKVVVAADEPWRGEVYETRAGRRREAFDGPAEFLDALMRLTGWDRPNCREVSRAQGER